MKVSGACKKLIKKILYIKNQNLEATEERAMLDALGQSNPVNYYKAWEKHMKAPWSNK
jgi:hypothetical protein